MQSARRSWISSKRTADLRGSHVQSELLRSPCIRDIQADRVFAAHVQCQLHQLCQSTARVCRWTGTKQLILRTIQGFAPATFRDLLGLLHGSLRSRPQTSRPANPWVGKTRAGMTTLQREAGVPRNTGLLRHRPGAEPPWRFLFLMEEPMMICRTENLFCHLHHLFRSSRHHTRQDLGSAGLRLQNTA